jgi:hypothetical protein
LDSADKVGVDALLYELGGFDAMQLELRHVVARENNQLVRAG